MKNIKFTLFIALAFSYLSAAKAENFDLTIPLQPQEENLQWKVVTDIDSKIPTHDREALKKTAIERNQKLDSSKVDAFALDFGVRDVADNLGDPHKVNVIAAEGGEVTEVKRLNEPGKEAGWQIKIKHKGGYATAYTHVVPNKDLKKGMEIGKGAAIGVIANKDDVFGKDAKKSESEWWGGPHLHFQVNVDDATTTNITIGGKIGNIFKVGSTAQSLQLVPAKANLANQENPPISTSALPHTGHANSTPAISSALMHNQLTAITQGGSSHIGSAALFTGYGKVDPSVDPNNTSNAKVKTGAELAGYATNTQAFQASAWQVATGTAQGHFTEGNSFGPISAPNGGQITALNNANVQYTHLVKEFQVPVGVKQVTLTINGNFVTNEYPVFVGSQFNDYGVIKLVSPSGTVTEVTAFKEALNSSNFQNVAGLPAPMMASGGQTGFKSSAVTIPVANGGKVIVDVQVHNVGDTQYPSAVLMNNVQLK